MPSLNCFPITMVMTVLMVSEMRTVTVFYAWQSDTPEQINRYLIRSALDAAAERITNDPTFDVTVLVDSDTQGVPGQPKVTDTILSKIDVCDIFVPDMSFVAQTKGGKLVTNSNVMIEFGYAMKARGLSVMMSVMNTAFGPPEKLPFDLGLIRHPIQYRLDPNVDDAARRAGREQLSKKLEEILRLQIAATQPPAPPPIPFKREVARDGPARFRAPGAAIGVHWDEFVFRPSGGGDIRLADGSAMWLRVMPSRDPGQKLSLVELKKHAIQNGIFDLKPFWDFNIAFLRAEDGMGICSRNGEDKTTSVAFAFQTGEVWAIDTALMQHDPTKIFVGEIEKLYPERLGNYARFLSDLGIKPPYDWIGGLTGLKDRLLLMPARAGSMIVPGFPGHVCLGDTIMQEGKYDGGTNSTSPLVPFFEAIYDKCGIRRPDHLSR